jgi:hypothetical protein
MQAWNRKQIAWLIIAAIIFVFACDQQTKNTLPEQSSPVAEQESGNPVSQYGESMISAYTKGKQAGIMGNLDAVRKTIKAYHASHDKYPESLDEIKHMFGSPIDLSIYDYDPDTGEVSLKK